MSLDKISKLVGSITKSINDDQRIATPILAAKVAKCLKEYPYDQTLGAMSVVLDKMADKSIFIRRAELKDLYAKLYSRNTKFADLFHEELGIEAPKEYVAKMPQEESVLEDYKVSDQILSNALASAFDSTIPLKNYSQDLANKAIKSVAITLDAWNLRPTNLSVTDGNENFLVIKADYETPKGVTGLYIPVEIVNNKITDPSLFMGNSGPQELTNTNIKAYVTSNAGSKLKITASNIITALTSASSANREISAAEIALTRLNASRQEQSEYFGNQIVGQEIDQPAQAEISIPESPETQSFAAKFESPYGTAAFNFGEITIKTARDTVYRDLIGFGYKNPQITVTGSDSATIFYGVSLDGGKVAFTVPVKVADGKINKPTILLCNGSVSVFNKSEINKLSLNNQTDFKVAAATSPLFGLKPSDLINNIRDAVSEGNHAKAEDALNVLATCGDEKAYASGFHIFVHGLGNKEAAATSNCSMVIKHAASQHDICGHTGLPTHKVYQDKYGNCQPLYRRGMDETYEGATFNNSKIFG